MKKKSRKLTLKDEKYGVYYTPSGLNKVKKLYRKNWVKLKNNPGCEPWVTIEYELDLLEMAIRREIGQVGFSCPDIRMRDRDCSNCSGIYYIKDIGYVCALFDYSAKGSKKDIYNSLADALREKSPAPGCKYDVDYEEDSCFL